MDADERERVLETLDHPSMVGEAAYTALHELIVDALTDGTVDTAIADLDAIADWAYAVKRKLDPTRPQGPKVQIIHSRDPDMGCEHSVYVDGVKLDNTGYDIEDVDPGAGAERADWDERIEDARKDTSAFGQELLDLLTAYSDSPYIE